MTPTQRRAYNQMRDQLIAWLRAQDHMPADADDDQGPETTERAAIAQNQLVAILRLTQITSGFVTTEDGASHLFLPNPKLDACETLVRDIVGTGRSVIVWAKYKNDITALCDHLFDLRPARIDGSQQGARGQADRDEAERSFQARETRVLVGNPASGGLGLNLQAASVAIYYSHDYSLLTREQSEDRCHRSGSEIHNKVLYLDLICTNSIDSVIREAVRGKKKSAAMVVDLRRAIGA